MDKGYNKNYSENMKTSKMQINIVSKTKKHAFKTIRIKQLKIIKQKA